MDMQIDWVSEIEEMVKLVQVRHPQGGSVLEVVLLDSLPIPQPPPIDA